MTHDLGPTETERARKQERERESFLVLMAIDTKRDIFFWSLKQNYMQADCISCVHIFRYLVVIKLTICVQ